MPDQVSTAANLLMDLEDAKTSVKFVLHDRDASFATAFDAVFQAAGARVVRSAIQGELHRSGPPVDPPWLVSEKPPVRGVLRLRGGVDGLPVGQE